MRGTQRHRLPGAGRCRIILAHAGNSSSRLNSGIASPDHPRACGKLNVTVFPVPVGAGSSSRMRGTPPPRFQFQCLQRIIPAHAGNSPCSHVRALGRSDHPRACGKLNVTVFPVPVGAGSSSRMRGTPPPRFQFQCLQRIIPAHAGNSAPGSRSSGLPTDHPRACGELEGAADVAAPEPGSSPRMRGTLYALHEGRSWRRIIPAHAGNSCCGRHLRTCTPDHPRACGELEYTLLTFCTASGSSPRMRGTRDQGRLDG